MDKIKIFRPDLQDICFISHHSDHNDGYRLHIDEGISYGLGFFETILLRDKAVFLKEHLDRLNNSLLCFHIPIEITPSLVEKIITHYQLQHIALKIQVTALNVLVSTRSLTYTCSYYEEGTKLKLSNIVRSSRSFLVGHKSCNYGDMILSLRQAQSQGYHDSLFFNEQGYLSETAIHNIFIIKDGQLMTPNVESGILPGIIRQYILNSYPLIEKKITIDDLVFADGVFLTNSLVGLVKVSHIHFDQDIIQELRLVRQNNAIPDNVTYVSHPFFEQISNDYVAYLKEI
jgi:4-amino-4-deoxychorismate lyase